MKENVSGKNYDTAAATIVPARDNPRPIPANERLGRRRSAQHFCSAREGTLLRRSLGQGDENQHDSR